MKNSVCVLLFLAFISCTNEVKFNSPALEGQKNNVFWRAVDVKAKLATDGSLTIEGFARNEKLTLRTMSSAPQTYILGLDDSNKASYVLNDANGTITFSTGLDSGEGRIVIEEFDAVNKTITGTFKFNADKIDISQLAAGIMHFHYGRFYKVPVTTSSL